MKQKSITSAIVWLALCGVLAVGCTQTSGQSQPQSSTSVQGEVSPVATMPTSELSVMRYKPYQDIAELKNDSVAVLVAEYLEPKRVYEETGVVFTESLFRVNQVIKGEDSLVGQQIVVNETGGIYQGKKHVIAEDGELFGTGAYLLFLDKRGPEGDRVYDIYFPTGVFSGKFKLENGKVKGYGTDAVKAKAEKLTEKELIEELK